MNKKRNLIDSIDELEKNINSTLNEDNPKASSDSASSSNNLYSSTKKGFKQIRSGKKDRSKKMTFLKIKEGMELAATIYNESQLIMEAGTILDSKKIEYLKTRFSFLYIKQEEVKDEPPLRDLNKEIEDLFSDNSLDKLVAFLQTSPMKIENFTLLMEKVDGMERNPEIDAVFDVVLKYFDVNIRKILLNTLSKYDPERFKNEIFSMFIEFDPDELKETDFFMNYLNEIFQDQNRTFFVLLNKYFDTFDDDRQFFFLEYLKKLEQNKLKKLLFYYSEIPETKDLAFTLLQNFKEVFIDGKKQAFSSISKIDNKKFKKSFDITLKQIEERKLRKESVKKDVESIRFEFDQNQIIIEKTVIDVPDGVVLSKGIEFKGATIYNPFSILSKENRNIIELEHPDMKISYFNTEYLYEIFQNLTKNRDDILEKIDLFTFYLIKQEFITELEALVLISSFPDEEIKAYALSFITNDLSPKKFKYVIESIKLDIPSKGKILRDYFEQKNDLFSFKLFLKLVSDRQETKIIKFLKKAFSESIILGNMLKKIIKASNPSLKKTCLDILG
ncbi:MAG: hypothetical protein C0601_11165 [Candidatus Muiribacterium halophilum]|uniref:Uncharacterized protein n=1 Tax=Muiribacterium halophilum TaxID=2053465 RepID=A0A2N5ZC55_MUIH1|nr:MAG: hypothetical protein C0601_11165 [Candidatus Muirbacterium halophilum]